MTKKNMTNQVNDAQLNVPVHLPHALKAFAEALMAELPQEYLDKEARKARGNTPMATGDGDIEIITLGQTYTITSDDPDKPMVSVPVGMSDKVTTASIPWQKICGVLFQELISLFDRPDGVTDSTYAMGTVMERINWFIDQGLTEEDGRLKIDQSKLPEVRNADEVAQFLNSLKRQFKSKSRGTPALNLSVVCPQPPAEVLQQTFPTPNTDFDSVFQIPNTDRDHSSDEVATRQDASPSLSRSVSPNPVTSGETEGANGSQAPSTIFQDRELMTKAITEAIGGEPRTIGYLKKVLCDIDENAWKARLKAMLETGEIVKEGERRSCRYSLPEVVA